MLLQEPAQSPYDIRFQFLGFPVRVSWTFWLMGLVFGYSLAKSLDGYFRMSSPGLLPLLLLSTLCVFVSILIHELGHALAFRQYGIQSSIVLYYLGGLAIPTGSTAPGRSYGQLTPKRDIWVSLAGPLAQLLSAVVLAGAVKLAGYRLLVFDWMPGPFYKIPGVLTGHQIDSPGLLALVTLYIFPSVLWALMNLAPVLPLDGGRIMKSLVQLRGGTMVHVLWISVIAAALVALYGFSNGTKFMGFLFLMLGITNFQTIQQMHSPRF